MNSYTMDYKHVATRTDGKDKYCNSSGDSDKTITPPALVG